MKRKLFAVGIGLACCIAIILLIWFWKSNKPEPTGPPQKEIVVVPSEPPSTEQTQQEMRPVQPSVPDNFNEPVIEQNPPKKVIEIQDFEVAFPKSSMVIDVAPGDSAGILKEGIILLRGSTKYMLDASGDGAIYKQQGSTLQCLYAASERTWMDSLSEQDGYLYFLMATQLATGLYRIPCTGGTPELVFDQISGYSIWGRTVYASTDDSLLAFSLDAPDQTIILWENTPDIRLGFYRAVSDGIVFVLYSDHLNCLYFQDRNGDRALLGQDDAYYATPQVVDDFFYYFSHRYLPDTVKHELYRINWKTGVKELCHTVPDSPNTYNFVINNDLLYLRYDDMLDTMSTTITVSALNGGNASTIVQYENRSGKYAIEITHLLSFEPSDDYLYFNGYSYTNGYHIITRYPIMGDGVQAQEEILYSGQWYPLEDYLNTFGVTVAKRIRNQFQPLFDPATEPLSPKILSINDYIREKAGYSLYDAQLVVAESVKRQLSKSKFGFIVAECGSEKGVTRSQLKRLRTKKRTWMFSLRRTGNPIGGMMGERPETPTLILRQARLKKSKSEAR